MRKKQRFVAIGETIIDFVHQNETISQQTLIDAARTCYYLSQYNKPLSLEVYWMSFLGVDHYNEWLLGYWQSNGINTAFVQVDANFAPTLRLYQEGDHPQSLYKKQTTHHLIYQAQIRDAQYIYLSGIASGLLPKNCFDSILNEILIARKNDITLILDACYEANIWQADYEAKNWFLDVCSLADIVITTPATNQLLFGNSSKKEQHDQLLAMGISEIISRSQDASTVITANTQHVIQKQFRHNFLCHKDAYNAAYIAARIKGLTPTMAVRCAHNLVSRIEINKKSLLSSTEIPILF